MDGAGALVSLMIAATATALVASSLAVAVPDVAAAPKPGPGTPEHMKQCVKDMAPECGKAIFQSTFHSGTVSPKCCVQLVKMGKPCHDEISQYIAHGPDFKARLAEFTAKSDSVYRNCSSASV